MSIEPHLVPTPDGWLLALHRVLRPDGGGPVAGPPVVVLPGYGMNATLFTWHPRGRSFVEALRDGGFDAWTVDWRGQGESRRDPRGHASRTWGLREYAFVDVKTAIEHVCSATGRERVTAIGCSLGGTLVLAYGARFGTDRLDRFVAIGAPLLLEDPGPFVRATGLAGPVLAVVPLVGLRALAARALPIVARYARGPLSVYLDADHVDLSRPDLLARIVERPRRRVNAEIARWIRAGRLVVDGVDVAEGIRGRTLRTLLVVALDDGIVNPASARSVRRFLGEDQVDEITVGGPGMHVAHADLFLGDAADEAVFQPVVSWLRR